jgi:hypothetical protein
MFYKRKRGRIIKNTDTERVEQKEKTTMRQERLIRVLRGAVVLLILLEAAGALIEGPLSTGPLPLPLRFSGGRMLLLFSALLLIAGWRRGTHPLYEDTLLAVVGMSLAAYLLS